MTERSRNLDLIRVVAIFFVLSSHFLLRNGFYDELVAGKRMYVMVAMRYLFMSCVPLFLLLTGYLNGDKRPEKAYFRKLGHTIVLYIMASVVCLLCRKLYHHEEITFFGGLLSILNYTASSYGWYVEMYVGLFLMLPFLNMMFNGLNNKRQQQLLLIVLVFVTSAASIFNVLDLTQRNFLEMHTSTSYTKLVPDFWIGLYPIQYYMIGRYIRVYGFPWKPGKTLLAIIAATGVFSTYNYIRKYQQLLSFFSPWLGRSSIQNLIISVLLFGFLLNLRLDAVPDMLAAVVRRVSKLSFLIYLISSATDSVVYPYLWLWVPNMTDRLNYYLPTVGVSFLLALIGAQLVMWLYSGGSYLICRSIKERQKTHETTR